MTTDAQNAQKFSALAEAATRERQQKHLARVPPLSYGIVQKAFSREGSPRNAIKAKCLDCSYWSRDEVRHCLVVTCPLWPWRPFQKKDKD